MPTTLSSTPKLLQSLILKTISSCTNEQKLCFITDNLATLWFVPNFSLHATHNVHELGHIWHAPNGIKCAIFATHIGDVHWTKHIRPQRWATLAVRHEGKGNVNRLQRVHSKWCINADEFTMH